jgi:hypothetical protein
VPDTTIPSTVARQMWRTLEPYHGLVYFSHHAAAAYAALGIEGQAGYFASRAAALGPVPAEVVIATFYNFDPRVVRAAIPAAWQVATPAALLDARLSAVDAALREALGDDVVASDEMAAAAEAARRAAGGCTPDGRPLYAAHAALPWPDEPHLVLWLAVTQLREFRGDGHIAALVVAEVDPCEALVTHGADLGSAVSDDVLQRTRGWPDEDWAAAADRLRARGWLDAGGAFTPEGEAARQRIEQTTDDLAMAPWRLLGEDACADLRRTVRPWSRAIVESGALGRPPAGTNG